MSYVDCREAAELIKQGKIIAYPTEAVYGLCCDPLNQDAVKQLLNIKGRSIDKGLILIASNFEQLRPFIQDLTAKQLAPAIESWPGPFTWLIPAKSNTPYWLTGNHQSIAVRITNHPIAKELCSITNSALVSTSANFKQQQPATSAEECVEKCPEVNYIILGDVDKNSQPTSITDLLSGDKIRI